MNYLAQFDSSQIARFTSTWAATKIPTKTTLSYVDPTNISGLESTISMIEASAYAATELKQLYYLQRDYRAAQASLTLALAQQYLQTATATQYFPQATQVIFNATLNLHTLNTIDNPYGTQLNIIPNVIFASLFAILLVYNCIFLIKSKELYFSICFICGTGLEFAGYIARTLAVHSLLNSNMFLCQIICLTMAPAFMMAGIYLLLAKLIVIHGNQYSILKPLWFSYIFISCDFLSLIIQAIGGGIAGMALQNFRNTDSGTRVMVAGIGFQVLTMSIFLILFVDFIYRIFFKSNNQISPSISNFCHLFFNTSKGKYLKSIQEDSFLITYQKTRQRPLINWMPMVLFLSVLFIYIRSIYRVVELSQGWTGYLITREVYVFTLDGLMVLLCCLLYVVFHPRIVFGKFGDLSIKAIKRNHDESNEFDKNVEDTDSFEEKYTNKYSTSQQQQQQQKHQKHDFQQLANTKTANYPKPYSSPYTHRTSYSMNHSFRGSTLGNDSDYDNRKMNQQKLGSETRNYPSTKNESINDFQYQSTKTESITDYSIHSARPQPYRNGVTMPARTSDHDESDLSSEFEEPSKPKLAYIKSTRNPYKTNYQANPYTFTYDNISEDSFEFA